MKQKWYNKQTLQLWMVGISVTITCIGKEVDYV